MIDSSCLSMVVSKLAFFYLRNKWNKIVGKRVGYGLEYPRFESRRSKRLSSSPKHVDWL